jgi:hypothetical protein
VAILLPKGSKSARDFTDIGKSLVEGLAKVSDSGKIVQGA